MKKSIKKQIWVKIKEQPRGWVFSAYDFTLDFKRREIDESLSYLAADGKIKRVIRGIYYCPMYSELLKMKVGPDIDQVANALARKFKWKIYPNGDTVLNYLRLSAQIAAKDLYLTDGPSKKYFIGNRCIEFKHIPQKETALKNTNTFLVIQSIKAIGEKQITEEFLHKLAGKFSKDEWSKIKADASNSTGWVYKLIKELKNG